jgi:hypothetical protein
VNVFLGKNPVSLEKEENMCVHSFSSRVKWECVI